LSENINISCPNCNEENSVKLSSEIKCKNCEESLTGIKYAKLKKPLIGTFTALMIGGFGGHKAIEYFDTDRYPMSVEHSILENCISSYDEPLRSSYIRNKKEVCVCAFQKTLKEYDYKEFKKNQYGFLNTFETKSRECR
jgi:hypothetical protein